MKIVDLEQGSDEWLQFRRSHITATDVRSILGICPFKGSPLKVWESKCLGKEPEFFSPAAERGNLLEPSARAWLELELGMDFKPAIVESLSHSWAMASLDGINEDARLIVEIKCGGSKLHDLTLKGEIPDYYLSQIQWQLFCTGYDRAIFVSFMGMDGHYIEIHRDEDYINHLFRECEKFWKKHVLQFEPPEPGPNDWVEINSDEWAYAAQIYKEAYEAKRQAENQMDAAKATMETLVQQVTRAKGCGISFYRSVAKGNVDYKALIQDKGIEAIELEQYRKPPTERINIRINEVKS
jgi:putative phage-type endonuclease